MPQRKTCPSCRGFKKCLNCAGTGVVRDGRLTGRCGGCGGNRACSYCRGRGQVAG